MPGLFASETAAPLLWQTASRLRLPECSPEECRPPDVVQVPTCAVSGDLLGEHCPNKRDGWFIGGVSPIASCKVHQKHGDHLVEVWSADRLEQFRKAGFPRASSPRGIPGHRQRQIASMGPSPKILSPQSALTYYIQPNEVEQNRLLLEATAAPGTRQIHWFADRRYLGASPPAEPLPWQPIVGDYELQAMDDSGRVSSTRISVRLAMGD
jgi:penicillin-binding protein 1C